jgi:type IV secretion system protein TrbF
MIGFKKKTSLKKTDEKVNESFGEVQLNDAPKPSEDVVPSEQVAQSKIVKKEPSKKNVSESDRAVAASFNSNPYLDARREWNERYGSYIAHARNWRLFALGMLGITLVESIGLVVLGSQNKLVPYIVEVDKLGAPLAVSYAEQIRPVDERVLRFLLARFLSDVRSVVSDGIVQRQMIDRVYSMLPAGSQASQYASEYLRNPNPFVRAQTMSITVEIKTMLKLSEKTWQVEWIETSRNLAGGVVATSTWRASTTLTVSPPDNEDLIKDNPIGLFITNLDWAEVKGQF